MSHHSGAAATQENAVPDFKSLGPVLQSLYVVLDCMAPTLSHLLAQVPDLADHEARRLLLLAAGADPVWMIGDPDVSPSVAEQFRRHVARRRSGEPLQYIEGTVQFGPLELLIDERALIPRPETERLWELLAGISELGSAVIVDLCTGSGNLALALSHSFPGANVFGVDSSTAAVALAQENASKTMLNVRFLEGDLFEPLPESLLGNVDLVVSNPPYIAEAEVVDLPGEIRDHEPIAALEAGPTGLEILNRIAGEAVDWLRPGAIIACEIGETQGEDCLRIFSDFDPRIERDLAGRPRYILGRAPHRRDVH